MNWPLHPVESRLEYFSGKARLERALIESGLSYSILRPTVLFGKEDILINNIERGGWPVVHGPYTTDQWDLELTTTLKAKRWVFDAALPHLKASGDGLVINISSIAAVSGRSGPAGLLFNDGYAAANRGVGVLTETWARLGAPSIRVNELMLGLIEHRSINELISFIEHLSSTKRNIEGNLVSGV